MEYALLLLGASTLLPAVHGVAFGGPEPTAFGAFPARAAKPAPTQGPSVAELQKRQLNLFSETCGWVDNDISSAVTCPIGAECMVYTASNVGMVGCCDSVLDPQDCGWVTSCMDYSAYQSDCDSDCMLNTFIRKCSRTASPYCVSWTYPGDDAKDYGCASTSDSFFSTVLQSASDDFFSSSTSISLSTVTGSAVTGWDQSDGGAASSVPTSPTTYKRKKKGVKLGLGAIIGIVVVGLFILFVIVAGIIFCLMKRKKARQLAENQQLVANAQQNRQSQYAPSINPQQMQMQTGIPPPMPVPQNPQPGYSNDYFGKTPPSPQVSQVDPHKVPQTPGQDYVQSPISNPPTPAPAYVQPYYASAPPMPAQSPGPYQATQPANGAYELQGAGPVVGGSAAQQGPVYEIGNAK